MHTNRRDFLKKCAGVAGGRAALGKVIPAFGGVLSNRTLEVRTHAGRPNVLVLQPDQHRATIMGCAGDQQVTTPNLDRLAAEGIHFTHCVSSSPVCSPFRGTFQTGLYPHKHGVVRNNLLLDPGFTTFAEVFAGAGYATGYIGKWHLDGGIPAEQPGGFIEPGERRQGWQQWYGYEKSHEFFEVWKYDENRNKVRVEGYDWEPTWYTDVALDFARRNRDAGKPWLYYIAYGPPHAPLQCPQKYLDMYDPAGFVLPPDVVGKFPSEREQELRRILQIYYGQITAVDFEIGRVVQGLKELGLDDNTIILYTSDHGDRLGSHCDPIKGSLRGKSQPYATAFRIPLIVRWPSGIKPGQVCDALVNSVDLAPTLLELAGLDIPKIMQGDSMANWCLRGRGKRNEAVYFSGARWRAVWDGRYIFSPVGAFNILYDHKDDPYEMSNLFNSSEHTEAKARMCNLLVGLAEKTEDPELPSVKAACRS